MPPYALPWGAEPWGSRIPDFAGMTAVRGLVSTPP